MLAAVAVYTFVAVAGCSAVIIALHAASPDSHAAAGGIGSYKDAMGVLSMIGSVAGVLLGATAGGADIYRDLVATGRSRTALFLARVPGAWAIVVPPILAAVAVAAVLSSVLDGPTAAPSAGELASGAAGALVAGMLPSAACVGLASLANSRGMVIGRGARVPARHLAAAGTALADRRRALRDPAGRGRAHFRRDRRRGRAVDRDRRGAGVGGGVPDRREQAPADCQRNCESGH
jgi:hypothetical protein